MKKRIKFLAKSNTVIVAIVSILFITTSISFAQIVVPFTHTGAVQQWEVPAGITSITVRIWGAGGGGAYNYSGSTEGSGGSGAFVKGTLGVTPGQILYIVVGGQGVAGTTNSVRNGGYGGGGQGGKYAGAGGGYSGIFFTSVAHANAQAIAGGGAGGGYYSGNTYGGAGGAADGTKGGNVNNNYTGGFGGTVLGGGAKANWNGSGDGDAQDGSALQGGNPLNNKAYGGGGGGGGYFGGGSGYSSGSSDYYCSGGGGGSSYTGGLTGVTNTVGTTSTNGGANQAPGSGETGYYVAGIGNSGGQGGNGGHGRVVIEHADCTPPTNLTYSSSPATYCKDIVITANNPSFTGTNTSTTYTITSGSLPSGLSMNSSTGVISGTPTATGNFSVTIRVANSCGNTTTSAINITVNNTSTVSAGSNQTIGRQVSAQLAGTSSGASSVTWSSSVAGTFIPNANNPNAQWKPNDPLWTGTATLTLTANTPCGNIQSTVQIVVEPYSICPGENNGRVNFPAAPGGSTDAYEVSINGGGTWTPYTNGAAINTTGATTSVKVRTKRTTGSCASAWEEYTIWAIKVGPIATVGGALSSICQGGTSAQMGGSVSNATSGTWTGGSGTWTNPSNPSTATYTAGAGETGTITLTLTATSGSCGSITATKNVLVNGSPSPTFTSVSPMSNVCEGTNVTYTTQSGMTNYTWTIPGTGGGVDYTLVSGGNATSNTAVVAWQGTGVKTLSVNYQNAGGCAALTATSSTGITLPPKSGSLATHGEVVTCAVNGNNWVNFYHPTSGNYVGSVNGNSSSANLGNVTITSAVGSSSSVFACNHPGNELYRTAYMGRNWLFTSSNYPGTNFPVAANVRLPYSTSELTAMNTTAATVTTGNVQDDGAVIGNLMLTKFTGATEDNNPSNNCSGGTVRGVAQSGNGAVAGITNASYVQFSVAQFSEMYLNKSTSFGPLPVTLTNFSASCDKSVKLSWSTASEQNSDKFIVESSMDGIYWNNVSSVQAAGNSNTPMDYSLEDVIRREGISYYRLIQIDLDGKKEIYGPISVSCEGNGNSITVYPNPTNGAFTVELTSEVLDDNTKIMLTDVTGKIIEMRNVQLIAGINQILFDVTDFEMGTYLISVRTTNGNYPTLKLIKK